MRDIAATQLFTPELLTNEDATIRAVMSKIMKAATQLDNGDIFLFTFAGHGSYLGDEDGDEPDARDETLVLWDLMLSDDVLRLRLWPCFKPGVRVVMIADSCQSGTVDRLAEVVTDIRSTDYMSPGTFERSITTEVLTLTSYPNSPRTISDTARLEHIAANRPFYDGLLSAASPCGEALSAGVLLLSACRDDEETADGDPHGAFTQALLDVWHSGDFVGNYNEFIGEIRNRFMGTNQHPGLTIDGQPDFSTERPFSI
jgi:hypothetical protein